MVARISTCMVHSQVSSCAMGLEELAARVKLLNDHASDANHDAELGTCGGPCGCSGHLEGRPDRARVLLKWDVIEERHGAWNRRASDDGHDAEHGQSAIVDLGRTFFSLLLLGLARKVLVAEVPDEFVCARLAAAHVMGLLRLAEDLEEPDEAEDGPLALVRDVVPGRERCLCSQRRISRPT